jgi:glucosamine-phosphate N-acetyltransferase
MNNIEEVKLDYFKLLNQLTSVEIPSNDLFMNSINIINKNGIIYICYTYINNKLKIVGTCTGYIEQKLIHGCSKVCHVEDVVVDLDYRNKNICKNLINFVCDYAMEKKCYKAILNCKNTLNNFYSNLNFIHEGDYMVKRFIIEN